MSAHAATLIQAGAAIMVTGTAMAFVAYVTGLTGPLTYAIRHPLRAVETVIAVPMSWLPAPRRSSVRRHYRGRHVA